MSSRFLGRILLLFIFYLIPIRILSSINWNDNATIADGTVIKGNLTLAAGSSNSNDAKIIIDGTVYIEAEGQQELTISVTNTNVTLGSADGQDKYGHIIFYAAKGKKININCDYDLKFTSSKTGPFYYLNDMTVTFSGPGTTTFNLSDNNVTTSNSSSPRGSIVSFKGYASGGYANPSGFSISSDGTSAYKDLNSKPASDGRDNGFQCVPKYNPCRVYILMDQTKGQALNFGNNKLVFKRKPGGFNSSVTHPNNTVGVHIGEAAMMTYLSDDASGGYGSIAFDPTHTGTGTMFLDINQKDDSDTNGGFNDGSLVIFGHKCGSYTESDIRSGVQLDSVAGKKAIFRVIDDSRCYYNNGYNINPDDKDIRGLMIINRNTTVPKFASDPYQENTFTDSTNYTKNHPLYSIRHSNTFDICNTPTTYSHEYWSNILSWGNAKKFQLANNTHNQSDLITYNVQTGFVLGKNGRIEIAHKTFLDYVATQTNMKIDPYLAQDYSSLETSNAATYLEKAPYFKKKNPAALFVDGLYAGWNETDYTEDTNAEIYLYGDSKILLRAGSKATGDGTSENYPITVPVGNGDHIFTFTIDSGTYNGQYVSASNVTEGEGVPVLDLEAPLIVRGLGRDGSSTNHEDLTSTTTYSTFSTDDVAEFNMPTISIDYRGKEFDFTDNTPISRPLTKNSTYQIYDSPNILLNSNLELHNIVYNQNDITKLLSPNPDLALPNIVGGERKYFNDTLHPNAQPSSDLEADYEVPRLEFYNSILDMHEHFVVSGFKLLVNEEISNDLSYTNTAFDNTSSFIFREHGYNLDVRDHDYGRLFMASSSNNKLSDGSTGETLENTSLNVFRRYNKTTPAEIIKLSLSSELEYEGSVDKATTYHLVMLNRGAKGLANMSLGWTSTIGDTTAFPWEDLSGDSSNYFDINTINDTSGNASETPPATVSIDSNYIYFDGIDSSGNKANVPVVGSNQGSVIYVNHGGRITITQPDSTSDGYDAFFDLPIAYRLWHLNALCGIIDLPKDQVEYGSGFGRQPYNLDTLTQNAVVDDIGGIHLNTFNSSAVQGYSGRIPRDRHSGEEYILDWGHRTDRNTPLKEIELISTKYTAIVNSTVNMSTAVLPYFGASNGVADADIVTQLQVAGATKLDPMRLLITGTDSSRGYGWVKEIVPLKSNSMRRGEGNHGIIFLKNGGRLGLGNNNWNDRSANAWNLLGQDFLTISPAGNGTIDLNSDIFVIERGAFIAEKNFGSNAVERLTINLNGHDLYVPAGGELDLSSFGQSKYRVEIEFAGEGRVVLGAGAVIRFPATTSISDYPVLYFNDNTKLVIEDDPEVGKSKYSSLDEVDIDKVKIFGKGQIWLNKNARFEVMGGAKVRVGSDSDTPNTNLVLSIQRQGDFLIGSEDEQGGSFEIGNPSIISNGSVDFELILNGEKARTHLDRGAFLGFGVGMIDNSNEVMNGDSTLSENPSFTDAGASFIPDTSKAWHVKALCDVNTIKITNKKGIFDHSNIFDGSNRLASMIALGPVSYYTLDIFDPLKSRILGGGNIMLLKDRVETYLNAWQYADPAMRENSSGSDHGMYNMLASSPITLQWRDVDFSDSTITTYDNGGENFVSGGSTPGLDFFRFVSYRPYRDLAKKLINCGATEYETYIGYVNTAEESNNYSLVPADQIYRRSNINIIGEGLPEDGLEIGVLGATGTDDISKIIVVGSK